MRCTIQVQTGGAIVESCPNKHRYLIDRGWHEYDSLNEFMAVLKERMETRPWIQRPNDEYTDGVVIRMP